MDSGPSEELARGCKWLGSWTMSIMTTRGLSWLHIDDPRSDSHVPSDTSGNPARPASR
ncbi:unnamed protein product [Penicillium camemberti]|uniref:Str. FM013 n=1 Tax=Penicillium camemberti (strain FM 013) TaxID=1429867 RepID=A0A0G4PUU5_PENC3|nr:unnamed protein product [Penicillium camemberti]